jgi:hypothetical protein
MMEAEFRGPRPATQFDSVPTDELARLRRIEAAALALLAAFEPGVPPDKVWPALQELRHAIAP